MSYQNTHTPTPRVTKVSRSATSLPDTSKVDTSSSSQVGGKSVKKRHLPALSKFVDELDFAFGLHPNVFERIRETRLRPR